MEKYTRKSFWGIYVADGLLFRVLRKTFSLNSYLITIFLTGIPATQQHLLQNQIELSDSLVLKDIPVYDGMKLKLVLGMKVGPIQSARRVLPSLSDYDSWFDINDVMQNSK